MVAPPEGTITVNGVARPPAIRKLAKRCALKCAVQLLQPLQPLRVGLRGVLLVAAESARVLTIA